VPGEVSRVPAIRQLGAGRAVGHAHPGVGVLAGLIVFAGLGPILLYRRSYSVARVSAVAAVVSVIAGWGVGQYPWMLVDQLTITDGAGAGAILAVLLIVVTLAVVIVLPALGYLLRLTQRENWSRA